MGHVQRRPASTMAVVLLAMGLVPARSDAHALGAECKLAGGRVELEAYYDDDTPARNARVRVENVQKTVVAEGRTDGTGCWSFARPQPGQYFVRIDAGAGHQAKVTVTIPLGTHASESPTAVAPVEARPGWPEDGDAAPRGQAAAAVTVSAGPERGHFTRFPWMQITLGLAIIGGASLAVWGFQRLTRHSNGAGTRGGTSTPSHRD